VRVEGLVVGAYSKVITGFNQLDFPKTILVGPQMPDFCQIRVEESGFSKLVDPSFACFL
jgi:hypothetical protein